MRDVNRRLEALEVAQQRRNIQQALPPGITVDMLLDKAIEVMEMPLEQQRSAMPMFTAAELAEITTWLPHYRKLRWYRSKLHAR